MNHFDFAVNGQPKREDVTTGVIVLEVKRNWKKKTKLAFLRHAITTRDYTGQCNQHNFYGTGGCKPMPTAPSPLNLGYDLCKHKHDRPKLSHDSDCGKQPNE